MRAFHEEMQAPILTHVQASCDTSENIGFQVMKGYEKTNNKK